MKKIVAILVLLLCSCAHPAKDLSGMHRVLKLNSSFCDAVVSRESANLFFPIWEPSEPMPYEWNRATTPDEFMEYQWSFRVQSSNATYEAGAFLFKHANDKPASGSLDDLIRAMQHSVFIIDNAGGGGSMLRELYIDVGVDDGGVIVSIVDRNTLRAMFESRPKTATFSVTIPEQEASSVCTTEIQYE